MSEYYKSTKEVFRDLQKEALKYNALTKKLKEGNKKDTEKVRYYEKAYRNSISEHDKKSYKRTIDMLNAKRELREEILEYDKKIIDKTRFNKDCFAYKEKNEHIGCKALNQMDCKHCKFYRNDITESEIEQDIRHYANTYK